ncbi:MAG TPA: pirin family protein [Hyphomonadaceae bacterium]|nr:pirin family protein [Hyphomonadaceae bacterium]HPN04478.1 pirin family protein [Hyphomonadaceae bacterium]
MADDVEMIIEPRQRDLGGFFVRRLLPFPNRRNVGPFVFFDHLGPAEMPPGKGMDVRSHPHIGLATVTWLFDGALDHRDSLGTQQTIRPGAVNWMTAGRGIVHSERTPPEEREKGHRIEAIQTWVALPQSHAEQDPTFQHYPASVLPIIDAGGATGVLISGSAYGQTSPVEFPAGICQLVLTAERDTTIEAPEAPELCIYVLNGSAKIGDTTIGEAQMAVLNPARPLPVTLTKGTRIMFAGGDPLDGPRFLDWNFVASSKERLAKASADWRTSIAGNFTDTWFSQPPHETAYIPLPGDPQPMPLDHIPDDHDENW